MRGQKQEKAYQKGKEEGFQLGIRSGRQQVVDELRDILQIDPSPNDDDY